ncbi:TPA: 50S ribosomal protein L20 [Candidatus Dependentiae bacterium]|nr:MAG: 50S ribosomal protein L20 [candidate division TM6 bacterium GW2011_GWE2_31_21]KKP53588.1 MAG: 50S ribosomal protein L20 [candidate division TM6 bacterium GW2011_GWF2_33_332]HBS48172.1 50S ribosomal protein L20 [Candidatus Dependentiae bacterium]HBZ73596.1 50S ribosomal protein L20 [Candidatus Dependentiae bacterium]
MSRIKRGMVTKRRHKKVLKQAKGFWGQRKNIFRRASETLRRALAFAFKGRRLKKRDFRALFITRVSAACKANGISYSVFMHSLKKMNVSLNRKMLSQLAIFEPKAFEKLTVLAKNKIS